MEVVNGIVLRSTGQWYRVLLDNGEIEDCRLLGKFRLSGFKSTNPVAVGDHVRVEISDETGTNEESRAIIEILPRKNYILRKSINLSKRVHILCANVDQALILFTLDHPVTTLGYVDRLTVSCVAYGIEPLIIFNKTDLLQTPELQQKLKDYEEIYRSAGFKTLELSAIDPSSAEKVKDLLFGKVSFVVGRSGAGKSTMINLAAPELDLKTGDVSAFSGRGKHTTTFAEMFKLPFEGWIIDSPGFKGMEIYDIEKQELGHFFPEFIPFLQACKFSNCTHLREPGCAIKRAVEEGQINETRYNTYLGMLTETGKQ